MTRAAKTRARASPAIVPMPAMAPVERLPLEVEFVIVTTAAAFDVVDGTFVEMLKTVAAVIELKPEPVGIVEFEAVSDIVFGVLLAEAVTVEAEVSAVLGNVSGPVLKTILRILLAVVSVSEGVVRDGVETSAGEGVGVGDGVGVVEGGGESVDTISPLPFSTIPSSSAQHDGSLSQQKLPSEHVFTRGRKPVPSSIKAILDAISKHENKVHTKVAQWRTFRAPRILGTRRPNQVSIYTITKPVWITPRFCLATDKRARALCVIWKSSTIEIKTGDLAGILRICSLWTSRVKKVNWIVQGHSILQATVQTCHSNGVESQMRPFQQKNQKHRQRVHASLRRFARNEVSSWAGA